MKKSFLISTILLLAVAFLAIYFSNRIIESASKGKLFSDTQSLPFNRVGLLLGTSKYLRNGNINPYYKFRIDATLNLFNDKKIKYLVISGDNGREEYNEPEEMRNDLIDSGIDSSLIYLDYAGFRTFDSIVRLKEIFGQDSVTIISQPFHNQRAIYIASHEGISAIGFNAKDVSRTFGLKVQAREKLARAKVFIDYLFQNKPKFLREKINIPQ